MNPATLSLLKSLGFECDGVDPDALSHHRYVGYGISISVPAAGCSVADIVRLIFHAGASAARKDIATKHKAFIEALRFPN